MLTKTLRDIRGRVPASEVSEMSGTYFVYWGAPSLRVADRIAVLHLRRENGTPACQYVTGDAEVIELPEGMRPEIRWYKACRACSAIAN